MRQKVVYGAVCVLSNVATFFLVTTFTSPPPVPQGPCLERAVGFQTGTSLESNQPLSPSLKATTNIAPNLTVTLTPRPCQCEPLQHPTPLPKPRPHNKTTPTPTIFVITPTYARLTQKSDLTSVCHTLSHVQNLVWIVIEDSDHRSELVEKLLQRCNAPSVHLNAVTPKYYKDSKWKPRGVLQRNTGLSWIREHHTVDNCSGIVYFGDDDNSYDLRLFEKMRETEKVSVWPVAFSGGVRVEGPLCRDGVVARWRSGWGAERPFPIDMAGFAVHLCLLMNYPTVVIGRDRSSKLSKPGYLESNLLEQLVKKEALECRGPSDEVIVWHVKTEKPDVSREGKKPSDTAIEV